MVWVIAIVTGIVSVIAVPLVLAWWRLEKGAFRYPDEEEEAARAQTAKDAEGMIIRLRRRKRRGRGSKRHADKGQGPAHQGDPAPGA